MASLSATWATLLSTSVSPRGSSLLGLCLASHFQGHRRPRKCKKHGRALNHRFVPEFRFQGCCYSEHPARGTSKLEEVQKSANSVAAAHCTSAATAWRGPPNHWHHTPWHPSCCRPILSRTLDSGCIGRPPNQRRAHAATTPKEACLARNPPSSVSRLRNMGHRRELSWRKHVGSFL